MSDVTDQMIIEQMQREIDALEERLDEAEREWYQRYREQAEMWDQRTQMIRKQLDTLMSMVAQNELLKPPIFIGNKRLLDMLAIPPDER